MGVRIGTATAAARPPAAILAVTAREDACLGFANTLSWRGSEAPVEALGDFPALLAWCNGGRSLPATAVRQLAAWSDENRQKAAELHAEAIALREVIYRTLSALADGRRVSGKDFAALARAIEAAPDRRRLVHARTGYAWRIELDRIGPDGLRAVDLLAPALWSAADLLAGGAHCRVRRCANAKCLWLFLDRSKNGTRRWCDMASCGNRAKARRHYLKIRQR